YGRRSGLPTVLALPAAVALAEWAYPLLFPSVVAASFLEVPQLMQLADIGGAYLVDAWVAFVGSALFEAVAAFRRSDPKRLGQHLAGLAVSLVFVAGYGTWRLAQVDAQVATARRLEVALIQANLGAAEKTTRRQEFLLRHQEMSRAAISAHPQTQLVVWPEAAFNRAIPREMKDVGQFITVGIDRPVLSGAITVLRTEDERFVYNSAILTSSTGQVRGVYDKVELLAFGETIPFVDRFPSLKKLFPYTGTFDRGKILRHFQLEDGTKLLPMICYEDLLPSLVRRLWRADGPAEVLVNVTNDSWYGDTHEPGIHLALATLRSIETRRALIRSTNTGISAIVDPGGRVVAHTGQWTQEILPASVPLIEDGSTTIYLRVGDWPAWLSLFGFLGLWGWRRYGAGRRA
ncbi:MAG: apolipoprotein N-acyltransferase, partial [Myxococcota bacterium]